MTSTTTLMTFLVRVPSSTRSVTLLGSWDNFSKPYAMQRDARRGKDLWTGCHSFENIICDGNLAGVASARDGGLKMGGTYWYYYRLDDGLEIHDSAQLSTTSCPLLPGQLVNVLHVPFHLSNGRPRNASVSSTSSDLRTMNPEDKFLNPRSVPVPQPKLARLNTSPTLPQHPNHSDNSPWSASSRSGRSLSSSRGPSPSNSATALRKFRLPHKASVDGQNRSVSPTGKTTGLRAALRQFASSRSASPEESTRGRTGRSDHEIRRNDSPVLNHIHSGRVSKATSPASSRTMSRDRSLSSGLERTAESLPKPQLPLRRGRDQASDQHDGLIASSFQSHRRHRSRSKEPSSLRNSLTLPDDWTVEKALPEIVAHRYQPMDPLKEAPSQQSTPTWPTAAGQTMPEDLNEASIVPATEKRLPTLPNSPSSAYPPSLASDSPAKRLSDELKNLQSHFSEMTVSTASVMSPLGQERSHFSQWTTPSEVPSPALEYFPSAMVTNNRNSYFSYKPSSSYTDHMRNHAPPSLTVRDDTIVSNSAILPSTVSCSTISSCGSTSPPSPSFPAEDLDEANSDSSVALEKRYGITSRRFPGYTLPEDDQSLDASTKLAELPHAARMDDHNTHVSVRRPNSISQTPKHEAFSHSITMQQLMDELSYLGDMIQR